MSSERNGDITREGFACSYGRFYAEPGRVEQVEGSSLRAMFLPKLSPEGKSFALRTMYLPRLTPKGRKKVDAGYSDYFVRGQLKHYGVPFDEREISGSGTLLMKKVLQAGKCDKVPDHIAELREQMHAEWIGGLTPERLSIEPKWVIERYFLSSGRPERTKTTAVVGIPFDRHSSYRAGQMRDAASKIAGLHQETGLGPKTQTVFMGWDSGAVNTSANNHAKKEAEELQAAEDEREDERAEMHSAYLHTLKPDKSYSPVGSYIVDCEEIKCQWPDQADDLSLDICQTREPDIFDASFDFGVLEGVMIISTDKNALEQYCSQLDREADSNSDAEEDDEEDEDEDKRTTFSKRKAKATRGRGHPSKKSKAGRAAQPRTYQLKLKCRETGEGETQSTAMNGTIKFKDGKLASFMGKADLPCVGQGVPFTARKISDAPSHSENSWAYYSETVYDYARVGRWH